MNRQRSNLGKKAEMGSTAYVDDGAEIVNNVSLGRSVEILSGSIIGDNCIVGSRCTIGHPTKLQLQKTDFAATNPKAADFIVKEPITKIGDASIIRSGSTIYKHVVVGKKLRTGHDVLIREHVTIGDNCIVGTRAVLDGYIRVGSGSYVAGQCYVGQSVVIGNGVFIAAGCIFSDNKKMILGQGYDGATVEDYVRIGMGVMILPHLTIGKYAVIGSGSVVTKDVPERAVAYGVPAEVKKFQSEAEIREYMASIAEWE